MLNVAALARRLSSAVGRTPSSVTATSRLTTNDVLQALGPRDEEMVSRFEFEHGPHPVKALENALGSLASIVAHEHLMRQRPGYVRYFEVLPRIVFMFGRGQTCEEIARSMNFMATGNGIETVLHMTAETVARRINRSL